MEISGRWVMTCAVMVLTLGCEAATPADPVDPVEQEIIVTVNGERTLDFIITPGGKGSMLEDYRSALANLPPDAPEEMRQDLRDRIAAEEAKPDYDGAYQILMKLESLPSDAPEREALEDRLKSIKGWRMAKLAVKMGKAAQALGLHRLPPDAPQLQELKDRIEFTNGDLGELEAVVRSMENEAQSEHTVAADGATGYSSIFPDK